MSPRPPHRFYYPGRLRPAEEPLVALSPEESRHLLRVLRLTVGDLIDLFDSEGAAWRAELAEAGREGTACVRLLEPIALTAEAGPQINLAVSVLKRSPMDWMVEKLSELGVAALQPLLASRSIGQGDIKPYSEPPERWTRLAVAAAKQCGRNRPLELLPPTPLKDWLARERATAHLFYAHGAALGACTLGQALQERSGDGLPVWVTIGPEGGWTPAEQEAFEAASFRPVLLGRWTLRAETAAMAAAAACAAFRGGPS